MSVLWCGGEDIDFPNGQTAVPSQATGFFRSAFARGSLVVPGSGALTTSNQFPGGAVTTAWFSFRFSTNAFGGTSFFAGVGLFGTNNGLFVGTDTSTPTKVALKKWDGTTLTQLAVESSTSWVILTVPKVDMQIINYGVSATVNVYINGALVLTFTGDVTVSGMSNFDCAAIGRSNGGGTFISEVIVSTDDPRAWPGLLTMALTGAGTTNQWTSNTFSNINQFTFSDTSPTSDNTNADLQQYNVTDMPSPGSFTIQAVKQVARCAKSASPAVTQIEFGYNSGGSVAYGTGATKALTTAYASYEQLDLTNPVTSVAFVQSDMNALQLNMKAVT